MRAILYIFSGLPGSGKTTLAKGLVKSTKSTYLRIDTIEHGLAELCNVKVQGEGYRLTHRIVEDNLLLGRDVVVDSCNPIKLTREEWEAVAVRNDSDYINIEVKCSNENEHKTRIENRENDITGFILPTWDAVQKRQYEEWDEERIGIETSGKNAEECLNELLNKIRIVKEGFV